MTSLNRRLRSTGCGSCRRAKKGCDQQHPTCGRCLRLHQACDDYATSVAQQHSVPLLEISSTKAAIQQTTVLPAISLDLMQAKIERLKIDFFAEKWLFVFDNFLSNKLIQTLIFACALIAFPNGSDTRAIQEVYVKALEAVREAMMNGRAMKEDATLVALLILASFERYQWQASALASSWEIHVQGICCLVEARGINQIRTKLGRAIFRKAREIIIDAAFCRNIKSSSFVILVSQAINRDPDHHSEDQLTILEVRATLLWAHCSRSTERLTSLNEDTKTLDADLEAWELSHTQGLSDDALSSSAAADEQWLLIRLNTIRVVVTRMQAADFEARWLKRIDAHITPREYEVAIYRLYTAATDALVLIEKMCLGFAPTANALRFARPLFTIATSLIVERPWLKTRRKYTLSSLFDTQIRVAARLLRHLENKLGDRRSAQILESMNFGG